MSTHNAGADGTMRPGTEPSATGNLFAPTLPPTLARRRGGSVLMPTQAITGYGARPPSATGYRANTLLIPDSLPRNTMAVTAIDHAPASLGLTVELPARLDESLPMLGRWLEELRELPRAVVLKLRKGATSRSVDAWVAFQALRATGTKEG